MIEVTANKMSPFGYQTMEIVRFLDVNFFGKRPHYIEGYLTPSYLSPNTSFPIPQSAPSVDDEIHELSYHPNLKWMDMPKWWRISKAKKIIWRHLGVDPQSSELNDDNHHKHKNREKFEKRRKSRNTQKWKEIRKKGFIPRDPKFKNVQQVQPHSKDVKVPRFDTFHCGTHQVVNQSSVDFDLDNNPATFKKIASLASMYDEAHPDKVTKCAYRYVYVAVPQTTDGTEWECVCQIYQPTGRLNAMFSEEASRGFLRTNFPDYYEFDNLFNDKAAIEPHGEEKEAAKYQEEVASQLPENHDPIDRNACAKACSTPPVSPERREDILKQDPVISALDEMSESVKDVPEAQQEQVDTWMGHAENLLIFAYQMNRAQNIPDMFAAVAAYVKMYVKGKSVVHELYKLIDELSQSSPDEIQPHGLCDNIVDGWELIRDHVIFRKISYLISAAMSLTVSSMKEITWSPLGLKLIHIEAAKEQLKAVDLIDACVKTFAWMTETGWQCMKEKSLAPLLYGNQRMREFNLLYNYVSANLDAAMSGNLEDLGGFEKKADRALDLVCTLKKIKPDGTTAEWLQRKYEVLVEAKERIIAKRRNTNTRFAPIGWSLSGPTGVGKSTLAKLTMLTSLKAMEFAADPSRIITLDEADKYQSTYTSDIEGVYIDDFANMIAQFAAGNGDTPCGKLIKFFNNMAAQAIKAEIQQKGVVFIDFKCGVITTNVKDLDARKFSNCPESVLRRFNHVCVEVKPKFRKPGSVSLNDKHPDIKKSKDGLLTDVWNISIEEVTAFTSREGRIQYAFKPMETFINGKKQKCKNLSLREYLKVVVETSQAHKKSQEDVVARSKAFDKLEYCKDCCMPKPMCECKEKVEPHGFEVLGDVVADSIKKGVQSYVKSWLSPVSFLNSLMGYSPIRKLTTNQLASEIKQDLNTYATPWIAALAPTWFHKTKYFQGAVEGWQTSAAMYDMRRHLQRAAFLSSASFGYAAYKRDWTIGAASAIGSTAAGCFLYAGYCARKMVIRQEYLQTRDALPEYVKTIRDGSVPKFALMSATLVIGVKLMDIWNKNRIATQALDNPDDIDQSKGWFEKWFGSIGFEYKAAAAVKHTSTSQAVATLDKNLWWCVFTRSDGSRTACNIVSLQNGMILMPDHIFYPNADMTQTPCDWVEGVVRRSSKGAGGVMKFKADRNTYSYNFQELDLRLVYVPNLDNVKSNWRYLPLTKPVGNSMATFFVKDADAIIASESVSCSMGQAYHRYKNFYGGTYLSTQARHGSCMGMLVADRSEPVVLGFHVGGSPDGQGYCQTLTASRYLEGVTSLGRQDGVVIMAQSTELPKRQLGRDVLVSDKIHPSSKYIANLGPEAAISVLGSTKLRSTQKSCVHKSVISDAVAEVCGVPNKWGPPKLSPNWQAYNATLEHIVNPADQFVPSDIERARKDWLKPLMELMKGYAETEKFSKLSWKESIMGISGKRFVDALIMKTSMGFPVFGPKTKHFEEVRQGEKLVDRIASVEVKEEFARLMSCWTDGKRGYPVCSATLKDEPTPVDKSKVRVFQAAPIALSLAIRMYFLPIARFLSLHPLVSESAVGVNSFSTDWCELMGHAKKFAADKKVIAWDYSKYDVRMNSQMTTAVLRSYIDLARAGGYSEEDLKIMNNMIADIVHPLIDWNGTMIMAFNMNTSGNNITVNINSTAGSFYVRMGFFSVYPHAQDFRECVAAMTYGDDFLGSVRPDYRNFNFETYRVFLEKHGVKITLPDKGDNTCDFMNDEDADFLKRQSNDIEGIPVPIGRLTEDSIWKSLHSNLKSKSETERNVSISCIETALHEWFAYGKDHYNMRLEQMKEVCVKADLPQTPAFCSYEDRVERWHEHYGSSEESAFQEQLKLPFTGNAYTHLLATDPDRAKQYWDFYHEGGPGEPLCDLDV